MDSPIISIASSKLSVWNNVIFFTEISFWKVHLK